MTAEFRLGSGGAPAEGGSALLTRLAPLLQQASKAGMGYQSSTDLSEIGQDVQRAAEFALERKAADVIALDLRGISSATDYFLLATGQSDVQVKAIADNVIGELKKEGIRPAHVEGLQGGRWVLVDYIDFVVHIFHPGAREFYQLEVLWGDAPRHEFE